MCEDIRYIPKGKPILSWDLDCISAFIGVVHTFGFFCTCGLETMKMKIYANPIGGFHQLLSQQKCSSFPGVFARVRKCVPGLKAGGHFLVAFGLGGQATREMSIALGASRSLLSQHFLVRWASPFLVREETHVEVLGSGWGPVTSFQKRSKTVVWVLG